MRRYLFTLLMIFVAQGMMAQTTIVCNAEGELSSYLEEKAYNKTSIVISGPLNAEDIKAINNYPKIQYLNLREAKLSTIPEYAWRDLLALKQVSLPQEIDTLNLNAFSYQQEQIYLILTGDFPFLQNQPTDTLGIPLSSFPEFVVEDSNTKLSYLDFIHEIGIYSADRNILYQSFVPYGDDVEEVMPYAYLNVSAGDHVCIGFGERLKRIANNAFAGFEYKGALIDGFGGPTGLEVHFAGNIPPEKFGKGNLNIGYTYPWSYDYNPMRVVVPDKETYINADSSWGDLWLINESDWNGSGIKNLSRNDKTSSPYYDLMGVPVAQPTRGIYIKEGKKVVIGK